MHADLDDLLTALYVLVDDFLPARTGAGRRPRITDAELIVLAVAQILLQCQSERRFLRLARRLLGHLLPYIPLQSGYNKRLFRTGAKSSVRGHRMAEFMKTFKSMPADAEVQLPNVRCPGLVLMGTLDPDFADPRAEGDAIAAAMPPGLGEVATVDGAGHYPHAQSPDEVAALVIPFLKQHAGT